MRNVADKTWRDSRHVRGVAERSQVRLRHVHNGGFTLVELMVVVAVIGMLVAIAMPSWSRSRERAQLSSIGNNLRMIEAAKAQYALEGRLSTATTIALSDLTAYLRNNELPKPVVQETYSLGGSGTVADLVQADFSGTLAGKTSPLTVTNFD